MLTYIKRIKATKPCVFMNNRIAVCGHFAFGHHDFGGQTIKTIIVADELEKELGHDSVVRIDTHGRLNQLLLFFRLIYALAICKSIMMMPARNGLKILAPWLSFWNIFFRKPLFYVVIGGWLPELVVSNAMIRKLLKKFNGIYVETLSMKNALEQNGFDNTKVLPNCKPLKILSDDEFCHNLSKPFKLVTFSRVAKDKGIEEAVNAVIKVNETLGQDIFSLTIYGQINEMQKEWFEQLRHKISKYSMLRYGGIVPYDQSTDVIKDSLALLFPTYYEGEGFAGTIIDAFAAGVPVIATDWKCNAEIIKDGVNGKIVPIKDVDAIVESLLWIYKNQEEWNNIRLNCLKMASSFLPEAVIPIIVEDIRRN